MILYGLQLKKQSTKQWANSMFQIFISKLVAKHGLIPLLLKVGNLAVKATKSKKDDKAWAKVKKVLEGL